MMKKLVLICLFVFMSANVQAKTSDYYHYFYVDMNMELPDLKKYLKKLTDMSGIYDRGYESRFNMGKMFKKKFSQKIRSYGMSEKRIKDNDEEELLSLLNMMPKSMYQYVGPYLHEVPGISDKILNMPGIKETKNKFPTDVAERFQGVEGIEFLSPAMYFMLMPGIWEKYPEDNLDKPQPEKVQKPKHVVVTEIPDFLKKIAGLPIKTAEKKPSAAQKKAQSFSKNLRTLSPTLTSPLTDKDVSSFVASLDDVYEFGMKNDMENFSRLIVGEAVLTMWEMDKGEMFGLGGIKDLVNPCQRLVLKTRFAKLYDDFATVVIKQGFTPEEWAYTCDKTIKAFRVADANMSMAYAVKAYRRGYYDKFMDKFPSPWREHMYASSAAIIKMYAVFREDVEVVKPYKEELYKKMMRNGAMILTAPIFF